MSTFLKVTFPDITFSDESTAVLRSILKKWFCTRWRELFTRNSEGPFEIFSVAGVVPTRELWPYESILDFARAGNHIRTWGAPPLCPSVMAVVMRFNGAEKNYTFLYMHNFQTNWARKSRLVRIGQVFNLLKNLTNRDFLAQFVQKLCMYKLVSFFFSAPLNLTTTAITEGHKGGAPQIWYDFRLAQSLEYSHVVIVCK